MLRFRKKSEVLGQCSGQGISAPRKEGLSVYLSVYAVSGKKNKQGGWGNAFGNTPLNFLGLTLNFGKNRSSLKVWSIKVCNTLGLNTGTPKLCDFFVDNPWKSYALSNSFQENMLEFFYWNSMIQKYIWAMTSSKWELLVATKLLPNFKHLKESVIFSWSLIKKTAFSIRFQKKEE